MFVPSSVYDAKGLNTSGGAGLRINAKRKILLVKSFHPPRSCIPLKERPIHIRVISIILSGYSIWFVFMANTRKRQKMYFKK